eukprot:599025-Rhodomonas_salina.4
MRHCRPSPFLCTRHRALGVSEVNTNSTTPNSTTRLSSLCTLVPASAAPTRTSTPCPAPIRSRPIHPHATNAVNRQTALHLYLHRLERLQTENAPLWTRKHAHPAAHERSEVGADGQSEACPSIVSRC